ncbi:MAG TPA: hypothetical protein VM580_05110, partial [Labilithrix sp.]|nr:hypothetical protein [Labilithrix sp.]
MGLRDASDVCAVPLFDLSSELLDDSSEERDPANLVDTLDLPSRGAPGALTLAPLPDGAEAAVAGTEAPAVGTEAPAVGTEGALRLDSESEPSCCEHCGAPVPPSKR